MTGPAFARLIAAGRAGGWPAIYRVWAAGETTTENNNGTLYKRPAKRRTLDRFLERRTDLAHLLSEACEQKRNRLLNDLETEIERIALGPGSVSRDFDKKTGAITREKYEVRDKLYAILQLLKAHDRQRYGDQRTVAVEGQIDHRHAHAHLIGNAPDNAGGYRVSFEMLAALPEEERRAAFALLERLESIRLDQQRQRALPGQQQNGGSQ
ncbi:MAG: hypothetical protein GIKADHBN_00441 [Phycisphaerales bacterium]|nr:hypothetical protein [Phycisphaerales bacterium]